MGEKNPHDNDLILLISLHISQNFTAEQCQCVQQILGIIFLFFLNTSQEHSKPLENSKKK